MSRKGFANDTSKKFFEIERINANESIYALVFANECVSGRS